MIATPITIQAATTLNTIIKVSLPLSVSWGCWGSVVGTVGSEGSVGSLGSEGSLGSVGSLGAVGSPVGAEEVGSVGVDGAGFAEQAQRLVIIKMASNVMDIFFIISSP